MNGEREAKSSFLLARYEIARYRGILFPESRHHFLHCISYQFSVARFQSILKCNWIELSFIRSVVKMQNYRMLSQVVRVNYHSATKSGEFLMLLEAAKTVNLWTADTHTRFCWCTVASSDCSCCNQQNTKATYHSLILEQENYLFARHKWIANPCTFIHPTCIFLKWLPSSGLSNDPLRPPCETFVSFFNSQHRIPLRL